MIEELNEALEGLEKYAASSIEASDFIAYINAAMTEENTGLEALLEEAEDLMDKLEDNDNEGDEDEDDDDTEDVD